MLLCFLQSNYKIQAARLVHELEDLRRRVENNKMKLTAEMKVWWCFAKQQQQVTLDAKVIRQISQDIQTQNFEIKFKGK